MQTKQSLTTSTALVFHSVDTVTEDVVSAEHDRAMVITVHETLNTPTGVVLGAGELMSDSDRENIRLLMNNANATINHDVWTPDNLLMQTQTKLVWFVPAHKRTLFVRVAGKLKHFDVMLPSLVLAFKNGALSIAAYTGKSRPRKNQKLYHAPLWNIYASTTLCAGSATLPVDTSLASMEVCEEALFNSVYTHKNHDHVLAGNGTSTNDYLRFLKAKQKTGDAIKARDMNPLGKTLEQWV